MTMNYSKGKPVGDNGIPHFDVPPPVKASVAVLKETATTTSSILILGQNTTAVEISPAGGPAYIRWLTQSTVDGSVAATSVIATGVGVNYDHIIPAGTVRRFVVPQATIPSSYQSVQGINQINGLYSHMAYVGTATSIISVNLYGNSNTY